MSGKRRLGTKIWCMDYNKGGSKPSPGDRSLRARFAKYLNMVWVSSTEEERLQV